MANTQIDLTHSSNWSNHEWSEWYSLNPRDGDLDRIPAEAGIYRIRHRNRAGLAYVGESGSSIRSRILSHSKCYNANPPEDGTSSALWALLDKYGPGLDASFTIPEGVDDKQIRESIENALIAIHRRDLGYSPTVNFGRIIPGYRRWSSYRKGGPNPSDAESPKAAPSVPPLSWSNSNSTVSNSWMGLDWSTPESLSNAVSANIPPQAGVYRLWKESETPLLTYIGQSRRLRRRLMEHNRQYVTDSDDIVFSYARLKGFTGHHERHEIEAELLGAHWLTCNQSPKKQFGGRQV